MKPKLLRLLALLALCVLAFPAALLAADAARGDDGLVLYFPFDEGGGAKAVDKSGKGDDGRFVGSPKWIDGVVGKALLFDGRTFVRLPDGNPLRIDDEMTLTFWCRNDDQPKTRWAGILCLCDPSGRGWRVMRLRWGYNEQYLQMTRVNAKGSKHEHRYFRVGESDNFHFYAIVWKGAEVKVYKAGALTAKWTFKQSLKDMPKDKLYNLVANEWIRPGSRCLIGALDEYRVYNRALSAEDIKARFRRYAFNDYPNLMTNSGFEKTAVPDWPDRWLCKKGYFFNRKDYDISVDRSVAHSGRNSLRIEQRKPTAERPPYFPRYYFFFPPVEAGDYVMSAYMKTDTPGQKVTMGTADGGGPWKTVALTKEWERYWLPLPFKKAWRRYAAFIPKPNQTGTIWLDDVMFARGKKPIPYRPSPKDGRKPRKRGEKFGALGRPLPEVALRAPAGAAPRVDGRLDDACWKTAARTKPFATIKGGRPRKTTRARVTYDAEALYVAFECDDPDIASRKPVPSPRDGLAMWRDELVEVFVDTDPSDEVYHHFVLSLTGAKWDCRAVFQHDTIGSARFLRDDVASWDAPWAGVTARTKTGWTAEIAVPWRVMSEDLGDPAALRVNLCRTAQGKRPEYSNWSIGYGNFNTPWRFGRVKDLKVDWRPYRAWVETVRLIPTETPGRYRLTLSGRNATPAALDLAARVRVSGAAPRTLPARAPAGGAFTTGADFDGLRIGENRTVDVDLAASGRARSSQRFRVTPEPPATLFARDKALRGVPLSAVVTLNYPADLLKGATLACVATGGGAKWSGRFPARPGVNALSVPTQALPVGPATLRVDLVLGGRGLLTRKRSFAVLPENTPLVWMDPVKGMIVRGKPFMPLCVNTPRQSRYDLADLKAHGINCILWRVWRDDVDAPAAKLRERLDAYHRHGLAVIPDFTYVTRRWAPAKSKTEQERVEGRIAKVAELTRALKDHPAVIAWHPIDEPRAHNPEMGKIERMARLYQLIKSIDPNRPVIVNLGTTGLLTKHAPPETSDAVMYDWYPYPLGADRRPQEKTETLQRFARRWAEQTGRPSYVYIGLNEGAYPAHIRLHRPVELRCRMYLELVGGHRGLFFFSGPPCSKVLWDAFGDYAREIKALEPALFNAASDVAVTPDFARIRTYVGKMGQGRVLIAVNPTHEDRKVTLRLDTKRRLPKAAEVLFEKRNVRIANGALVDRFGFYEVHVYRF